MRSLLPALCFFLLASAVLHGQNGDLVIGQWKAVLPYNTGLVVAQSPEHIYIATAQSVAQIDKIDLSPRYFSRVEGLHGGGVTAMAWSDLFRTLVIGYADGHIDLLSESGVHNVADITNNLSITGDKTVYDISLVGDSLVLLSCGFGIVQYHLGTRLFQRTAFTGSRALQAFFDDAYWYAALEDGVYRLSAGGFFQNFPAWELLGPAHGLPSAYAVTGAVPAPDGIWLGINDAMWIFDGQQAVQMFQDPGRSLHHLDGSAGHVLAGFRNAESASLFVREPSGDQRLLQGGCVGRTLGAVVDQAGRIWAADEWLNFRHFLKDGSDCQQLSYNSPFSFTSSEIRIVGDTVYVAGGTIQSNLGGAGNNAGIYVLRNGTWDNTNFFRYPQMADWEAHLDYNTVEVDPADGTIYAGSYYGGLLRIRGNVLDIYQDTNSALQGATGDPLRERVAGLVRDQNGHLWISNPLAPKPLVVWTKDGQWANFSPVSNVYLLKGMVDAQNNKWFVLGSGGVLVYHEGQDVLSAADDRFRVLNGNNANLPSNDVSSVGLDRDGAVWIGTDDGVGVVRCADVFDPSCRASRIIVTQEGVTEALLNDEEVRAIVVDGANRKWLGTRNGLFVQSPDGLSEVARFTPDNSPLLDRQINALAFHPGTGEMWVGTERGLMVFQTDAPAGGAVHAAEVEVYPNPVRPDYRGPIAIKGLPADANVKITDVRGQLVFETTALGGQAIWYGEDYTGRRASSGVYLVFSTSRESLGSPDKAVSKIVFLR